MANAKDAKRTASNAAAAKGTTTQTAAAKTPAPVYPTLTATCIQNPNRFWAIPLIGFLIKMIILIPVGIEVMVLSFVLFFALMINSFMVLFTGKYWDTAYNLTLGVMRLTTKVQFFMFGLTNKYPGFSLSIDDSFSVDMQKPEHPGRLFAFPLLGGFLRMLLLIPFFIFQSVIQYAVSIAALFAAVIVLFAGKFPEPMYELELDYIRVTLSVSAYFAGFSDKYPSFHISMNNKNIKIAFIILGTLMLFSQFSNFPNAIVSMMNSRQNTNSFSIPPQTQTGNY